MKTGTELHQGNKTTIYHQGFQSEETLRRYTYINQAFADGYLENIFKTVNNTDFSELSESNKLLLHNIVNGITSEVGRALVGLTFLQLAIKSISPDQSIRLHKGTTRKGSFSWVDGISMRTLDSKYNTPFLRKYGLLKLNKFGVFMTRSLAENYPYSALYKAEMRGPFCDWIAIVDSIEEETMPAEIGLSYLMSLLKNRSELFVANANHACDLAKQLNNKTFEEIKCIISYFFDNTDYSARAFEVSIHALLQAMCELHYISNTLIPLSQMRSANKKHGNIGDIELSEDNTIIEAWDAKYGKPYLRDELEELRDKLLTHPDIKTAGFIVNSSIDTRKDIINRKNELQAETCTKIHLFSFDEWIDYKISNLTSQQKQELGYKWINFLVESFAQKRPKSAPIDEPCDAWIDDLISILEQNNN